MVYQFNLGRHQLAISLISKRSRSQKKTIHPFLDSLAQLAKIATDNRFRGHPISRVLRRVFEKKKTRQIFGINLTAVVLLAGSFASPISAFNPSLEAETTAVISSEVKVTTESSIQNPLDSFQITQGYHFLHRAVDLKEETGAPIYPLKDGQVEAVVYGRFAYGNYVIIDHGDGFKSLYAHLAKIVVKEGEKIDQNTVLGTVGTSGFATGSHLHLEVYDHGQPFNPLTILKQASK